MATVPCITQNRGQGMPQASQQFRVTATVRKSADPGDGSIRIYGWAAMSRDDLGEPVIDSDSEYIPIDELERAAQRAFVRRGGAGAVGTQHRDYGKADLVESFVLSAEKREAFGLGTGPQGWMVGLRSTDPEVVAAVRAGDLLELSLRGSGRVERMAVPASKAAQLLKSEDATEPDDTVQVGVVRDLELADVELLSIVDRGASGNNRVRSRIVLVKRHPVAPSPQEGAMPQTDVAKAKSPNMILADLFESGKLADVPAEDKEALLMALTAMPMAPKPAEPAAAAEGKVDDEMPKAEDEEMPKAEDEEMTKRQKALQAENIKLRTTLTELKKRMDRSEVVDLVKRDMVHVPGASVDELADLVQECRLNLGKADAQKIETLLKGVSQACKDSGAFNAVGSRKGVSAGDANTELMTLAKALRDQDPDLSRHEAMLQAAKQRPDLWAARAQE